jgi:hypothetical protein
MPIQLRDKSDFYSGIDSSYQRLQIESAQHLLSLFAIRRNLHLDPNPRSPCSELESPMAAQNPAAQVNFPTTSFIRHLGFQFLPEISFPLSFRSLPPSFWFVPRPIQDPTTLVLWGPLILEILSQPNLKGFPSKRLYPHLLSGRMLSRTGPCPQSQAGKIGTRGSLQTKVPGPRIGKPSVLLNAWSYLWPRPQRTKTS